MAAPFTIQVEGTAALVSALRVYQLQKRAAVGGLIARYTTLIARTAKALAPVDTGELRESITADVRDALTRLVGIVEARAPHAPFPEFGTVKMQAQPYMRPALEQHAPAFLRELKAILSS